MNVQKRFKKRIVSGVMFVLGRAFQTASGLDRVIEDEVSKWEEGVVIKMQVLSSGPAMCIQKKDNRIRRLVCGAETADLTVSFKNIEAAFPVMTGQMGAEQGLAQNRMTVKGDIPMAMGLIRCINRLEVLLFPKFVTRRILKRVPPMGVAEQVIRMRLYCTGIFLGF